MWYYCLKTQNNVTQVISLMWCNWSVSRMQSCNKAFLYPLLVHWYVHRDTERHKQTYVNTGQGDHNNSVPNRDTFWNIFDSNNCPVFRVHSLYIISFFLHGFYTFCGERHFTTRATRRRVPCKWKQICWNSVVNICNFNH